MGQAFANIISQSEPRFTVGIFGGWGSGKTTLMRAIMAALPKEPRCLGGVQRLAIRARA